ncbi:hypothetical protein PO909_003309 [Leuciscus waleckii]
MNPAVRIMRLRQGKRPIEKYVRDFIELANLTLMNYVCLMIFIFFRGGLYEPFGSTMSLHNPHWSLELYIDLALQLSGSTFTVGLVDEEPRNPTVPAKSKCLHVSPDEPETFHVASAEPVSLDKMAACSALAACTACSALASRPPRHWRGGSHLVRRHWRGGSHLVRRHWQSPGPPSHPQVCLRSTTLLDCFLRSVWNPLLKWGAVMIPVLCSPCLMWTCHFLSCAMFCSPL